MSHSPFNALIASIDAMKMNIVVKEDREKVAIGVPASQFPDVLLALKKAFDAFKTHEQNTFVSHGGVEAEKWKNAINELIKWAALNGLPIEEAKAILATSIEGKPPASTASYVPMPKFAPRSIRKGKWNPKLKLTINGSAPQTAAEHRAMAIHKNMTEQLFEGVLPIMSGQYKK